MRSRVRFAAGLACVLCAGCVLDTTDKSACRSDGDCRSSRVCVAARCVARSPGDSSADEARGGDDAASPAGGDADAAEVTDARGDPSDAGSDASFDSSSDGSSDEAPDAAPAEGGMDPRDAAPELGTSRPNYAFVSSGSIHPQFSSLAAGDIFCMAQATAAGLPGKYVAWLSDATTDARDRLGGARGWVGTDGAPFAATVDDLASGRILYPLHLDERSMPVDPFSGRDVVTGTSRGRFTPGSSCSSWTSPFSNDTATGAVVNAAGTAWDATIQVTCSGTSRVYCLGVDQAVAVTVPPPPQGRLAFLTDGRWLPSSGISQADGLCQAEAVKAHLTGSFKALLATSQASISDHIGASAIGDMWFRPDGVVLTRADRLRLGSLLAAWHVSASGQYLSEELVVMGASGLSDRPNPSMTCNDWSTAPADAETVASPPLLPEVWLYTPKTFACSQPSRLYCLQNAPN